MVKNVIRTTGWRADMHDTPKTVNCGFTERRLLKESGAPDVLRQVSGRPQGPTGVMAASTLRQYHPSLLSYATT